MEILGVQAAKEIDRYTINNIGIPSIVLMENAAEEIFKDIVKLGESFLIFCGTGNNGGDGLAIAPKLILSGKIVKIYVTSNILKSTKEFQINYNILLNMKANIEEIKKENLNESIKQINKYDIVVDSIFGIGLNRDILGELNILIEGINRNAKYIVSVDNPSGLDCNDGSVLGIAIRANETFSINTYKKGFFNKGAKNYLGNIKVVNIGVPKGVIDMYSENVRCLTDEEYRNMIPKRELYGHKGNYGRVLMLAGSTGMTGAAYITTEAVIRTGAGLVTLVVDKDIQSVLSSKLIEAMTINYDDEEKLDKLIKDSDVIVCGPGIGTSQKSMKILKKCIDNSSCNMVMDADALNIISNDCDLVNKVQNRAIFTPHPGEMARLNKMPIDQIEQNRIDECKEYSNSNKIVTLLKGYNTVISDGERVVVNTTGNSKMASGGMGDCLTGIISGFLAQGVKLFDSAVLGAYIHGYIADMLSDEMYIVNARDIINYLPKTIQYIFNK